MRSMLLLTIATMTLVFDASSAEKAVAQEKQFPYEAIVEVDGEYVRSGPGPTFYPTDRLKRGDKVMIHRHDPGGWCMVAPPPGSFSWIRAEHVQKTGEDRGVLKANNVVVHVGSNVNPDEFTTIQANLSKGDAVQILGEQAFPFEGSKKLMYKVSPVKREWRWVSRKAIVAASAVRSEPFPTESPARPKKSTSPVAEQIEIDPDAFAKPISTNQNSAADDPIENRPARPSKNDGDTKKKPVAVDDVRAQLNVIDSQFREMIQDEPPTWDLKAIERQYRALEREANQPAISNTIALRLDAVSRYEKIRDEYVEFLKSTAVTKQRDAQLASVQKQHEEQLKSLGGATSPTPPNAGATASIGGTIAPNNAPATASPSSGMPAAAPRSAPPNAFAGAGIVQALDKSFAGGPQFLLVAPDGRFLAFLVPAPGVDLRRYSGKAMGLIGDRQFRKDWNGDTITVRGLQPVQLRAAK